ncbi:MAG: hypothetical protein JSU70_10755 [Phycisphaerales bacterium]|nr:MAG: hypothetical protein JSU70_10755 [Phycisphaerales bacterium]
MDTCKLCGGAYENRVGVGHLELRHRVSCQRCGEYVITDCALDVTPNPFVEQRLHLLSGLVRRTAERGGLMTVESKLLEDRSEFEARVLSVSPQSVQEKTDAMLAYVAEKSSYPGAAVTIDRARDWPLYYCRNAEELTFFLKHAHERELLDLQTFVSSDPWEARLSVGGWDRLEQRMKQNPESRQAFVAMWFDEETKDAYSQGIAQLEMDTGFSIMRIDMSQFNDKICDRILSEIRRSRFVMADVTGHRQGVYFEAGFAMGLGLPVIWTCRKDDIERCHFDTRQYNHITWETPAELREKLRDRIEATIGAAGE